MDSNGRHSTTSNGQSTTATTTTAMGMNKKSQENQQQNGTTEKIARHRPAGASVMNARDPINKQKMSNICEPGPLKRAQGNSRCDESRDGGSGAIDVDC